MSDNKPIIELRLTQKEIDALYIASQLIGGSPNGMRGVFSNDDEGGLSSILYNFVSQEYKDRLYLMSVISGSIDFKEGF